MIVNYFHCSERQLCSFVGYLALALQALYNLYFYRLSKFEGPKYLITSDIPLSALQLRGTSHDALIKAHEYYGDVVRIGPSTLSLLIRQRGMISTAIGTAAQVYPETLSSHKTVLDKHTITMASIDNTVPIRRAINPAFSHNVLLEREPMIQSHIQRLMMQLTKTSDGNPCSEHCSVDLRKRVVFSVFDINSDFSFGEGMGCVASGSFHECVQFVIENFYAATLFIRVTSFSPSIDY